MQFSFVSFAIYAVYAILRPMQFDQVGCQTPPPFWVKHERFFEIWGFVLVNFTVLKKYAVQFYVVQFWVYAVRAV